MIEFDKNKNMCYNIQKDGNGYIICPCCNKQKLFRVEQNSSFNMIYIWCKYCRKEICLKSLEP